MGLPSPAVAAWRRGRSLVPGVTSGVNREHRQASVTTETNTAGRATAKPRASRVAVLEDDVTLRDAVLLPLLRDHGFEAVGMGSAAELYRCMLRTQFDIVLLDIGLPGENGLEVASNLRQLSVGLGIVMLTGSRGRDKRVRAFNHGVDAYLTKPVDGAVLGAMLHSLSRRLSISRPGLRETGVLERFEQDVQSRRWRLETGGWCLVAPNGAMLALSAHERSLLTLLINAGGSLCRGIGCCSPWPAEMETSIRTGSRCWYIGCGARPPPSAKRANHCRCCHRAATVTCSPD